MQFYLGSHRPNWLELAGVLLFVSNSVLSIRRRLPRAIAPWALDSGAFSQIKRFGQWTMTPREYAKMVLRYRDEIGRLEWAAPQDWMCEPAMLAITGYDVPEHQRRTLENFLELRSIDPDLPMIPVLQGWDVDDYRRHWEQYEAAGVVLTDEPLVGVGSVCRRQHTSEIERVFEALQPLRLHGFGVKTGGLAKYTDLLASADSMAWSYNARRNPPLPGHGHKNCANCLPFALRWRERILYSPWQPQLRLTSHYEGTA